MRCKKLLQAELEDGKFPQTIGEGCDSMSVCEEGQWRIQNIHKQVRWQTFDGV